MRIAAVAILVAAVVAGLIYSGVLSRHEVEGAARKALTKTEGVVQEATGGYHGELPQNVNAAAKCRETLKKIEAAKRAVAQKKSQTVGTVPLKEVLDYLGWQKLPACPSGGTYSLNTLERVASCSIGGNQTASAEDDHMIQNW